MKRDNIKRFAIAKIRFFAFKNNSVFHLILTFSIKAKCGNIYCPLCTFAYIQNCGVCLQIFLKKLCRFKVLERSVPSASCSEYKRIVFFFLSICIYHAVVYMLNYMRAGIKIYTQIPCCCIYATKVYRKVCGKNCFDSWESEKFFRPRAEKLAEFVLFFLALMAFF